MTTSHINVISQSHIWKLPECKSTDILGDKIHCQDWDFNPYPSV